MARQQHFAVPGFNCITDVMVRAVLDTAEKCRAPVMVMYYGEENDEKGWVYLPTLVHGVAKYYTVPIVLHLDHATELDVIRRALDCGFTSVMYDGSALPYRENVANTQKVVKIAASYGVAVEAELGLVGGTDAETAGMHVANILTQPSEVTDFVNETGVDMLAVSIGTAHGLYAQQPVLDIPRLKELNAVSRVPLVMHGGSGTPDDQVQEAVRNGICKVNIYSDSRVAMWKRFKELAARIERPDPMPREYIGALQNALEVLVEQKIRLVFANDRSFADDTA